MTSFLYITAYLALFIGVTSLLLFLKKRSRQDRAPFPENTRLLRGPGESLRRKLVRMEDELLNLIFGALAVPLLVFAGFIYLSTKLTSGSVIMVVTAIVALLITTFLGIRRLIALVDRRRNTALGYFGELAVAEALDPLKATGHRVFHDVPGDGPVGKAFNLDHVVVGPAGVFAIETKTRRKGRARTGFMAHEIIYDGRTLSYPWGEDTFGLEQARRQTDWLAGFLQQQLGRPIPVSALLVFPGWFVIRKGRGAVNVLNPRELPSAIERTPSGNTGFMVPALDPSAIDLISRQLEARCRDVEL